MKSQNIMKEPSGTLITLDRLTDCLVEIYEQALQLGNTGVAVDAVYSLMKLHGIPKDSPVMQAVIAETLED